MSNGAPDGEKPQYEPARRLNEALQLLLTIGGTLTAVVAIVKSSPWIAVGAGTVVVGSLAWFIVRRVVLRRRRRPVAVAAPPAGGSAYLRGLLPFEKGEHLLGRGLDTSQLLAKLRSGECRFAYVSGEAGVGKTSLLRSAVLGELEKSGFTVIYCEKTGADPVAAALHAIRKAISDAANATTLSAALAEAHRIRGGPLVLIWDQFEEFFIAHRVKQERGEIFARIGQAYAVESVAVRFVVSVRKEFVDDLQDFAPWVPQPLDVRFSHRLRSWDPEQASAVLTAAAEHDEVPFADRLKAQLIRDLENGGEVRPVELQLVASRLAEHRVYDLDRYREAGAAEGVLTSYVSEIVVPPGRPSDDRYHRVARLVLRLLCADSADAKRPVGLTYDEIVQRVAASASDIAADVVQQLVTDCLGQATRAYVVILEDEGRYNLRHDYLARPVYEATAGLQTVEQRANRLLESYVALERTGRKVVLPWKQLRLIRRYATPQRKVELAAAAILSRSRRRYAMALAGTCLGFVLLVTLILPPRIEVRATHIDLPDSSWIISANGATAASFKSDGQTRIWDVMKPWSTALPVDIPLHDLKISDDGTWIAGITKPGAIYVWRANTRLTRDTPPTLRLSSTKDDSSYWERWGGVRAGWAYAFSGSGELYLWHPREIVPPTGRPIATFDLTSRFDHTRFDAPPRVAFSENGKYMAVGDSSGALWIKRLVSLGESGVILNDLYVLSNNDAVGAFAFTPSGRRLIYEGKGYLRAVDLSGFPNLAITHVLIDTRRYVRQVGAALTPDEEQLVYRVPFGSFRQWTINETVNNLPPPVINAGAWANQDWDPSLRMSRDGQWFAGRAEDGAIYVWAAAGSPRAVTKPVVRDGKLVRFNMQSDRVAVTAVNGETFVVTPGSTSGLGKPIGTLPASFTAGDMDLQWSTDGRHLYCFGGGDLFFGDVAKELELVLRAKSPVDRVAVSLDGADLIIFSNHHVTFVRRCWTLWHSLPVEALRWPAPVADAPPIRLDDSLLGS